MFQGFIITGKWKWQELEDVDHLHNQEVQKECMPLFNSISPLIRFKITTITPRNNINHSVWDFLLAYIHINCLRTFLYKKKKIPEMELLLYAWLCGFQAIGTHLWLEFAKALVFTHCFFLLTTWCLLITSMFRHTQAQASKNSHVTYSHMHKQNNFKKFPCVWILGESALLILEEEQMARLLDMNHVLFYVCSVVLILAFYQSLSFVHLGFQSPKFSWHNSLKPKPTKIKVDTSYHQAWLLSGFLYRPFWVLPLMNLLNSSLTLYLSYYHSFRANCNVSLRDSNPTLRIYYIGHRIKDSHPHLGDNTQSTARHSGVQGKLCWASTWLTESKRVECLNSLSGTDMMGIGDL